jgi:hypothetical protein
MVRDTLSNIFAGHDTECHVGALLDFLCETASAEFTIDELEPILQVMEDNDEILYRETDGEMWVHPI